MGRRGSMLRQTRHDTSATERNRQGRPGSAAKGRLLLALACLLATIVVSTAVADQPDLGPLGPGVPSSEDLITAIESRPPGAIEPITTDAGATNGVELQGIGRDDALAVLEGVFGNQLQAPGDIIARAATADLLAANVAVVSDGEDLESVPAEDSSSGSMDELPPPAGVGKAQLRGDTGDELAPPDPDPHAEVSQAQLLESSVPLGLPGEARAHEIVDLDLERNRSAINPAASLVDLRVPDELGDGIALPEIGVRVHVGGAAKSRTPSLLGDGTVAAYPNIATDTDFAVVATPTGFETFTQLRSADSPRVQSLPLVIPDNAELVAEDGGATIMRGSEVLVAISPPTAIDATGAPVPVELAVVDDAVEISVAPDESTRYPVLVDPLFQTYEWENLPYYQSGICSSSFETNVFNQCNNREEWGFEKIKQGGSSQDVRVDNQYWGLSQYVAQGTTGLYIATSNSLTSGDRGTILYSVPRYFTDQSQVGQPPTSYIRRMTLSKLLWQAYSSGPSPYLFAGLWDPIKPGWVSYYSHTGETGHGVSDMAWKYKFANGPESGGELTNPNTNVKIGEVSVQATETRSASNTHAYVGYASVELGDDLPPQAPVVSGQSGWVDHTAPPIAFTAIDSGLGVFAMKASPEGSGSEGPSWKASYGCIGVSGAPCPRTWSSGEAGPSLTYDPSQLPTGVNYLEVNAEDPVGNVSAGSFVQVKADHSAPEVSLAGSLTEQASLGLKRPSYTLRVDAVDGSPEAPQSGAEKTVIKVDGTVVDEYEQGCATQSCGISREWTLESQDFSTGPHTATVVAIDAVGRSSQQTLAFDLEPSPPTLELSGTLTEQEAIGASRPRYGLHVDAEAVAGTEASPDGPPSYHSTFGSSGTANGQFSHPAGIAVDASGNLWVVDENNDRVQKFNAKGEYLSSFGAPGSGDGQFGRPTDIAIDASGNLWVTDAGNKRVEKFTASGEYLMQFGSPGTGNGQLSAAETIAIDSSGDIWIGDTYNGRLQKFNAAGGFLEVISSKGSGEGQLIEPVSIDLGVNGDVWVADWGNQRVSVFSPGGEFVRQFGSPGAADGQFNRPDAIEVDAEGNVWVGDQNNDRIQQFNESGEYVGQFGSTGSGDEQFNFGWPMGIASDSKGNLWISDTGNHRVQRWEIPFAGPSYHSTFGSSGTANGQFSHPAGIAVDASGNLWVVDENNDRVQKFNAKGEYLSSFGAPGSGDGQFGRPTDIAIDASGNLWVTDAGNKRVEKFTASGEYLMQFGSPGTGNGQLSAAETIAIDSSGDIWIGDTYNGRLQKFNAAGGFLEVISSKGSGEGQLIEPVSIDLGVNGDVWVADWGNQRVSVFSPGGEFVRQFGSPGAADGQFNRPDAIEVDAEGNVWVGDQNNDRIQQFNESGEYVGQFGSTGSGDEQFNFGWPMGIASDSKGNLWISDTGNHRVQRWEQAPTSGSTVTTRIELDNELIAADEAACVGEACPLALDWTLESESYSEGSHVLTVSAADGLGNTAEEVRNIEIERDQVSPSLPWVGGSLVNAPEGWVTQQAYTVFAVAEDAGYGVTSLALKIDGETVKEQAAECGSGGCAVGLFNSIDTADFAGGAHPAELVATDGAGNETTKAWTINVNPSGQITAVEAEDTLDAVDDTAESTILAPPEETLEPEQMALGDNPGLEQFGEDIVSTGVPNTTTMTTDLADGFRIESPEGTTLITPHVEPTAEEVDIAEDVAGVAANTRTGADSVVRPEYNGAQTFQAIRLPSSPHSFSWTVHLWEGQSLVSIDDDFAEVRYEDGHRAFLIVAEEAHDATGAAVPTSLEVEGEVLTLNVDVEGASFVYPIVAGAGWETSYEPPTIIEGPEDELEILEREEAEAESEEEVPPPPEPGLTLTEAELLIAAGRGGAGIVPAPEPAESSGGATASRVPEKVVKRFKVCARDSCGFWWVEIKNPSYHYKRNSNGVKTAYWQAGTQVHCNWWYNSAYYLVLSVSGHGCGFAGQTQVWAGQHKHLTAWGRYKITAHIWLPTGGTIDRVNNLGLQIWVWPNGFQQRVQTKWDDPIPIETL